MGELLRRFWMPVLLAEELLEPDSPPVRVRILCENLVAFRDSDGSVGLLDEICPHRRASLFWGRNEESGLRCVYHGWKFDTAGNCLDMPNEPAEYEFKKRVKTTAYPAVDRGGVIWAYMGPKELQPELPELEWARVPAGHRAISKQYQINNWAQAVEGGIDSSHVSFLHRQFKARDLPEAMQRRAGTQAKYMLADTGPRFTVKRTDYGMLIGARREVGEAGYYWRISQFLAPFYTMIPGAIEPGQNISGHAWVPSDDDSTWTFSVTWNPVRPLLDEEQAVMHAEGGLYATIDAKYRPIRNAANDYLIDRQKQKTESYTGILGGREQDRAIQESMGPTVDRSLERLGTSDTAIIAYRRLLINMARDLQQGKEPHAAFHGDAYRVRSASLVSNESRAFDEAARQLLVSRL